MYVFAYIQACEQTKENTYKMKSISYSCKTGKVS